MITAEQLYTWAARVWANRIRNFHPDIEREDAIQEAVLRAWLKRDKFDPAKAKAVTFFSTVMRNEIHQHAKVARNNRRTTTTDLGAEDADTLQNIPCPLCDPLMQLLDEEERGELQRAIDSLPRTTQEVIELRINDTPLREIATMFGVSHQAITKRYSRAIDQIRDRIGCHD